MYRGTYLNTQNDKKNRYTTHLANLYLENGIQLTVKEMQQAIYSRFGEKLGTPDAEHILASLMLLQPEKKQSNCNKNIALALVMSHMTCATFLPFYRSALHTLLPIAFKSTSSALLQGFILGCVSSALIGIVVLAAIGVAALMYQRPQKPSAPTASTMDSYQRPPAYNPYHEGSSNTGNCRYSNGFLN